jgi:uncharacterized membrane protein
MKNFPWQKQKEFFTEEQNQRLVNAIKMAEKETSGEIRLYIESKNPSKIPVDRAKQLFFQLKMDKSDQHNATLIYVAVKHRQAAVYGDDGIHREVGEKYWQDVLAKMLLHFKQRKLTDGICLGIEDLGKALKFYFPYDKDTDKNSMPDEIVFGK